MCTSQSLNSRSRDGGIRSAVAMSNKTSRDKVVIMLGASISPRYEPYQSLIKVYLDCYK